MHTFDKPSLLPTWCRENQANVVQPPDSLRAAGYAKNEIVMAEHFNWILRQTGQWLGYLDQANAVTVMAATRDSNMRLIGGGNWSYNASTSTLAWDAPASLSIPGCPLAENTFPAGSAKLGMNQAAFCLANVPYTTTGGLTAGDANVTNIELTSAIAVGQSVLGAGVPANTTVTEIGDGTVRLSQPASATNAAAALTFVGSGALSVQSADAATITPSTNTVFIALGLDNSAIVGANSGQMAVHDGESKRLLQSGYVSTARFTAGVDIPKNVPVYIASAADGRTVGHCYPCDASSQNGATRGQFVGFTYTAVLAGATARIVTSGVLNGFSSLTTGSAYYLNPASVGAFTRTKPTAPGTYLVPVGSALSSSALRVNAAGAQILTPLTNDLVLAGDAKIAGTLEVGGRTKLTGVTGPLDVDGDLSATGTATAARYVSGYGFAQQVDMGRVFFGAGTAVSAKPFLRNDVYSGTMFWCAEQAGSILAVKLTTDTYIENNITITVGKYVEDVATYSPIWASTNKLYAIGLIGANAGGALYNTAPKGTYKFVAGDVLMAKISISGIPQSSGFGVAASQKYDTATRMHLHMSVEMPA